MTPSSSEAAAETSVVDRPPASVVIAVGALEMAAGADVAAGKGKVFVESEEEEEDRVCRICHVSPGRTSGESASELVQIGCGCKNGLGTAHRGCAETWFRVKGNRCCEICGMHAKNITGEEEDGSFMEEWHDRRVAGSSVYRNSSERVGCCRGQPLCNFLMACLVIAFILPWFFRMNLV
ncbi:uncharacterized protein M6B38_150570 [Iris pallida]|uniref:RING-CH-type domain-containing protein n=1 Tax=Iris pallida TaxID=29817 RepID=A0AAX6F5Q0_IRIPA|nr:uncharacterized protein M6B38_150570 [Iris pallida]